MQTPTRPPFFDLTSEQGLLRTSIAVTLFIALIGIAFGLASGSFSIVFDGVYSLADASMSGLSLVVVRLITAHTTSVQMSRKLRERFTMGFWHLEPMVLALNGILLSSVAIYALINAVSSLLQGGRHLEFGIAMVYALLTVIACVTIAVVEARVNRKLGSDFVRMDVKGWVMSASITAAPDRLLLWLRRARHAMGVGVAIHRPGGAGVGVPGDRAAADVGSAPGAFGNIPGDTGRPQAACG